MFLGHEKSQLLSEVDRTAVDATSLAPGLSIQSGLSGVTHHHARLAVANDSKNRRTSVESGAHF